MTNPNLTEIITILDRSGSMSGVKDDMEGGYNALIAEQKALPGKCEVTLVQFDHYMGKSQIETLYERWPVVQVPRLTLQPRGGTPLNDAIGQTIEKIGDRFNRTLEAERPGQVLVIIITDGEENQSTRFTKAEVKALIERQTDGYNWTFTFLGANMDAVTEAAAYGIQAANAASYDVAAAGAMFSVASSKVSTLRSVGTFTAYSAEERGALQGQTVGQTPPQQVNATLAPQPTTTNAPVTGTDPNAGQTTTP